MKKRILIKVFYLFCAGIIAGCQSNFPGNYKGTPYTDKMYNAGPQPIPGKIQCEYYDFGGEGVAADTVAWRQWHHWNYLDQIARIDLKKGLQTITLHTVEIGQMNYDFINFKLVK
jgi:hypothetical protein